MHNHQSALDSFMEDKAIQDLEDAGIYPNSDNDDYEPTFKDAVMALRILKATINIRKGTQYLFEINDDIEICHKAIDCIMEDINYDCYLEVTK